MMTQRLLVGGFVATMIWSGALSAAGAVSSLNSTIDFPHDQAYINTKQPTIIGTLRDAKGDPVPKETVQIFINDNQIGAAVSDPNGIYRFPVTSELLDGQYNLSIFCVESQAVIESNEFTIDTTIPSIVITYPQEGDIVATNVVTFLGTTEQEAMVITFLDDDTFGQICYADEYGNWSIEYEVDNGDHTFAAQSTDIAGNQGYMSPVVKFSVKA
jgi:hypothetical protein